MDIRSFPIERESFQRAVQAHAAQTVFKSAEHALTQESVEDPMAPSSTVPVREKIMELLSKEKGLFFIPFFEKVEELFAGLFGLKEIETDAMLKALIDRLTQSLSMFRGVHSLKDISGSMIRYLAQASLNAEVMMTLSTLRGNLAALPEGTTHIARLDSVAEYLERVYFLNKDAFAHDLKSTIIFIPLAITDTADDIPFCGLYVYPEFDERHALRENQYRFTVQIPTQTLGVIRVMCTVRNESLSCGVYVERPDVQDLCMRNKRALAGRLKKIPFFLGDFQCECRSEQKQDSLIQMEV